MNHSNKKDQSVLDNSFSVLILGITLGALGAILLGTQEGREFTKKTLDSISDDLNIKHKANIHDKTTPPSSLLQKDSYRHTSSQQPSSSSSQSTNPTPPKSQSAPQFFRHHDGSTPR